MNTTPDRQYLHAHGLYVHSDGLLRCDGWADDDEFREYHDTEWGHPVTDDTRLYEKVVLEGFQAGLSWRTILHKRQAFREAFDGFDMDIVAAYREPSVRRLKANPGIVRNERKIRSAVHNAQCALRMREEFGSLAAFFWQFVPPDSERPATFDAIAMRALTVTPTSKRLSAELKQRGWTFVGPIMAYAFMQAMGMVNDHIEGCHRRCAVSQLQREVTAPNS